MAVTLCPQIECQPLGCAAQDVPSGGASVCDHHGPGHARRLTILFETQRIGGNWYDSNGALRLQVRLLLLPRLIKQSFDQIRQAAADNPEVLIRLLSTIGHLSSKMQDEEDRSALLKQATAVWETATSKPLVTMDREDIEVAWVKTRETLAAI